MRVLAVVDVATVDSNDAVTDHQVCLSEEITLTAVFFCFLCFVLFLNIHSITFPTQNRTISETTWIQKQSGIKALSNFYRQKIREMWQHICWPAQYVSGVFVKVHTERSRQAMKGGSADTDPRGDGQESETETSRGQN